LISPLPFVVVDNLLVICEWSIAHSIVLGPVTFLQRGNFQNSNLLLLSSIGSLSLFTVRGFTFSLPFTQECRIMILEDISNMIHFVNDPWEIGELCSTLVALRDPGPILFGISRLLDNILMVSVETVSQ
jgi:hypothetical protein